MTPIRSLARFCAILNIAPPEMGLLGKPIFGFMKVAYTNSRQQKALLRSQLHSLPQPNAIVVNSSQEEGGDTGVRLRVKNIEVSGLQLENDCMRYTRFLT
jgi:hypothetical protein